MKTKTVPFTVNMPVAMHSKLSKLAEVTGRTPEYLLINMFKSDVVQAFDEKDLDFVMPYIPYDSFEEAVNAARAANAFEGRPMAAFIGVQAEGKKFYVTPRSSVASELAEKGITLLKYPSVAPEVNSKKDAKKR